MVCYGQVKPPDKPQEPDKPVVITTRVERVPVLFTAIDNRNRFVTDLLQHDVQVFDNKAKQEIVSFSQETDLPLRVGLLVDTSNSIRDRFKFEQEAAIEFLRSIIRPGKDQVFLMSYDTNVELIQDSTDDVEKLTDGMKVTLGGKKTE